MPTVQTIVLQRHELTEPVVLLINLLLLIIQAVEDPVGTHPEEQVPLMLVMVQVVIIYLTVMYYMVVRAQVVMVTVVEVLAVEEVEILTAAEAAEVSQAEVVQELGLEKVVMEREAVLFLDIQPLQEEDIIIQ